MTQQFETPGPVRVMVSNPWGEIVLTAHGVPTTEVEVRALTPASREQAARARVECREESGEHHVVVEIPQAQHRPWFGDEGVLVQVRVPEGALAALTSASADIVAEGNLRGGSVQTASGDVRWEHAAAELNVNTASGDVEIASAEGALKARSAKGDVSVRFAAGPLTVETSSGDIEVGSARSGARLRTASGDVEVGRSAGPLEASTASGDIEVREAHTDCRLESRSGDVDVAAVREGRCVIETMSGDVEVGVAPGSRVAVDTQTRTGDLDSDIPLSDDAAHGDAGDGPLVVLEIRTASGDVSIRRGRPIAADPA